MERGTGLAKEHNTMTQACARTQTARSGVQRANHYATASPKMSLQGDPTMLEEYIMLKYSYLWLRKTGKDKVVRQFAQPEFPSSKKLHRLYCT